MIMMKKKHIMVCVMQQGGSLGSGGQSGFFCSFKMILELVGFPHKKKYTLISMATENHHVL